MRAHVINNGAVTNTIIVDDLNIMPNLIDASLGGQIGDLWDGNAFSTPSRYATIEEAVVAKLEELAAYRYGRETAGIAVGGVVIKTDRESQGLFHRIWTKPQIDPDVSIKWKGANTWVQIGKAEIDAIEPILFIYIERCFEVERNHSDAINQLTTIAQVEAYDITTGWPDNT